MNEEPRVQNMSASGNTTESSSNCVLSLYDTQPYLVVAGLRVATGLISFCCCLLIVAFFVYTKKQQIVTNQVLVFYLAISALLHSFSYLVSRVNFYTERSIVDKYCLFAGPLEQYTAWTEWMCILCISSNLLTQVTCKPKRKKLHWVYFSLIFALPLLWCWVPFLSYTYGTSGPWCGIRIFSEDCEVFLYGVVLRFFLKVLPILILFVATIILSVTTWVLFKRKLHSHKTVSYPQTRPVDQTQLLAELKVLLWYPPVYTVLQILLIANLVYESIWPESPVLVLWYLQVLTSPLAGAVIALVIVLNSESNAHARVRSWIVRHIQRPEEPRSARSSCSRVSEYECELHVSFGDSLEGMQNQRRHERVRNSEPLPLSAVAE